MKIILTGMILPLLMAVNASAQSNKNNPVALIKTSMGDIKIELLKENAPKTVQNFLDLAEGKIQYTDPNTGKIMKGNYYDGVIFHRVIRNFMIQTGDPTGTGMGGPGYKFEDEINADSLGLDKKMVRETPFITRMISPNQLAPYLDKTLKQLYELQGYHYTTEIKSLPARKGCLAMANAGPDTNGSQFFINVIDTPHLDGKHTVFGQVIEGMDIVDKIAAVPTDRRDKPLTPVTIISIRQVK